MEQEFIQAFKEAIEREGDINLEDAFRNYEEWGSLAYLSVLAMIDENYGVQIELDDFKKLVTVRDLMNEVFKRSGRL
jgi:acyl carrier protein